MSQSFEVHKKNLNDIAYAVLRQYGYRPLDGRGAARWDGNVEEALRHLHDLYKEDWERAFDLQAAVELVRSVGKEVAERESRAASQQIRQNKPVVALAGSGPFQSSPGFDPPGFDPGSGVEDFGIGGFSAGELDAGTEPFVPTAVELPLVLEKPGELSAQRANRIEKLVGHPLVNLTAGVLIGFLLGTLAGRYFWPRR